MEGAEVPFDCRALLFDKRSGSYRQLQPERVIIVLQRSRVTPDAVFEKLVTIFRTNTTLKIDPSPVQDATLVQIGSGLLSVLLDRVADFGCEG